MKTSNTPGLKIPVSAVRFRLWAPNEQENAGKLQPGFADDPKIDASSQSNNAPLDRRAQITALKGLPQADYHRAVGALFGFPKCCIDFFADFWVPLVNQRALFCDHYRRTFRGRVKPGFVPCPRCLAERVHA